MHLCKPTYDITLLWDDNRDLICMSQLYNGQLLVSIEEYVLSLIPIDGKTRSNKQTYNVLFFRDIISYNLIFEKKSCLLGRLVL